LTPVRRYIESVVVQVYSYTKPANRRRTLLASLGLLIAAIALAWTMAAGRAGGTALPRVTPPGWAISFQPPPRFRNDQYGYTPLGPAYHCDSVTPGGRAVLLEVYRLEGGDVPDPLAACDRVLQAFLTQPAPGMYSPNLTRFDKKLGPLVAVEVWNPFASGMVVRAAVLPGGDAYVVTLGVQGGEIGQDLYHLFELACASIEVQPG
jgi:hypothetical protein